MFNTHFKGINLSNGVVKTISYKEKTISITFFTPVDIILDFELFFEWYYYY